VVLYVAEKDVRNLTGAASLVGIILTGACIPAAVIIDMGFPRWVVVPQVPSRDDRDGVLLVSDTDKTIHYVIDEIGEFLVSYLKKQQSGIEMGPKEADGSVTHTRQSVSVEVNDTSRHIELQVYGVDEGKSTA